MVIGWSDLGYPSPRCPETRSSRSPVQRFQPLPPLRKRGCLVACGMWLGNAPVFGLLVFSKLSPFGPVPVLGLSELQARDHQALLAGPSGR